MGIEGFFVQGIYSKQLRLSHVCFLQQIVPKMSYSWCLQKEISSMLNAAQLMKFYRSGRVTYLIVITEFFCCYNSENKEIVTALTSSV